MHDPASRSWALFLGALPALKLSLSLALACYHARKLERQIRHSPRWKQLRAKVQEYRDLSFGDPEDALKYLTLDYWLRDNIQRAMQVNVHRRKHLKILDVGCGSGMFAYVCRFWGHEAVGLDKPIAACRPAEAIVYSVVPETLGVPIKRSMVRPGVNNSGVVHIELAQPMKKPDVRRMVADLLTLNVVERVDTAAIRSIGTDDQEEHQRLQELRGLAESETQITQGNQPGRRERRGPGRRSCRKSVHAAPSSTGSTLPGGNGNE
jgi:hypothetical protein